MSLNPPKRCIEFKHEHKRVIQIDVDGKFYLNGEASTDVLKLGETLLDWCNKMAIIHGWKENEDSNNCECGAEKCGSSMHSTWCPKYKRS